jgi:uncharacterized protein YjbI with pentapeptide repeats
MTELTPNSPLVLINLRARTLAVLERLDPLRKVNVLGFLYEAVATYKYNKAEPAALGLYSADLRGVDMSQGYWTWIDLSGSHLNEAILTDAVLEGADLTNADLTGVDLTGTDLTDVNLFGATVTEEQLGTAYSLKGATMPDGSKHD